MENHHSALEHTFKCWMNDQGAETDKLRRFCEDIRLEQKTAKARAVEFNESIKD